ncbi:MAG: relaxase/mobilization nuclease domain-containing protein [Ruminococcus sp.]|nr:relaxase/mobilization nuclease domain-containing protein [Ruminococcus sp.]
MHTSVNKSLAYILDPDKTENLLYTTSINCMTNADQAYNQMRLVYEQFAKDKYNSPLPLEGKGSVKAIHYIMSFADSENVTPKLAHKLAMTFVRKTFGDDVQAVIATHVDKSHTHCHVIINSYSLTGQKYISNRSTLRKARENANGICRAFGITPALNFENKGRSIDHFEWEQRKKGTSWKEQIRQTIDELIGSVKSLDELLQALEERGYEIKHGKYISVKAPGQERFVRTKTLGEEYTEESLNTRILYRDVGAGTTPAQNNKSQLRAAYVSIIGDVRILAEQHKKIQRKRVQTLPYSPDNDLDVYKLSAQLSVISKDRISSIGELEGRIARLRAEYEKQRLEINNYIEEHNRLVSLLEQVEMYKALSAKDKLSTADELKQNVCRQAMENNGISIDADFDRLCKDISKMSKKISALKENLESCRQRYDVYSDIAKTYAEISKWDYLSNLVEDERKRREKEAKKKVKR